MLLTQLIAVATASSLSGKLASLTSIPAHVERNQQLLLHIYNIGFIKMGLLGLGASIVAFIVGPYIKRIAKL